MINQSPEKYKLFSPAIGEATEKFQLSTNPSHTKAFHQIEVKILQHPSS